MSASKIHLSADELELMKNSQWILTKNAAIEKMVLALAELSEWMKTALDGVPEGLIQNPPKISRGEKYEGLPYLMLDYPRQFSRENILALRTFFWWGNHCSVTLHCRGEHLAQVRRAIGRSMNRLQTDNYSISFDGDEWVHDLSAAPHHLAGTRSIPDHPEFIRIGRICELGQWIEMEKELRQVFTDLVNLLRKQDD